MSNFASIDSDLLDDVAGGINLGVCRDLTSMSNNSRRRGMQGLADAFSDLSSECRAAYREQHPGVINTVKSWF